MLFIYTYLFQDFTNQIFHRKVHIFRLFTWFRVTWRRWKYIHRVKFHNSYTYPYSYPPAASIPVCAQITSNRFIPILRFSSDSAVFPYPFKSTYSCKLYGSQSLWYNMGIRISNLHTYSNAVYYPFKVYIPVLYCEHLPIPYICPYV